MKIKISALIICFCTAVSLFQLGAQSNASDIQMGISGSGVFAIAEDQPSALKGGKQMSVWLRTMLNNKNGVNFGLGINYIGGFNDVSLSYTKITYPTEQVVKTNLLRLHDLTYLDAKIGWYYKPNNKTPWSFDLGMTVSKLINARGLDYKREHFVSAYYRITETSRSADRDSNIFNPDKSSNVTSHLNSANIGVHVGGYYQILRGIQLHAGFYRGFRSVVPEGLFPETDRRLISLFHLGLTARLF